MFMKKEQIKEWEKRKAPKGYLSPPWSLHIGSFWEFHFMENS
jgi:hypothetical protein